ncbi:MAG: hypothetical protein ABW196_02940 [Solirubrobacterales bacterium]
MPPDLSLPPPPLEPPPNGYFNGPCGLAVGPSGRLYVADHYHEAVDVFAPSFSPGFGYLAQLKDAEGACGLALDSAGRLYVNRFHGGVTRFGPSPGFALGPVLTATPATGVAVDLATDEVYVDQRTHISVYNSSGAPVQDGEGEPLRIGLGSLGEGYGVAVAKTSGRVYAADASDGTVKVYDPAVDLDDPVATIAGPPGGFTSLRDSALAVDDVRKDVYVIDVLQPGHAEQPEATVQVFNAGGAYLGHLKYNVVHGEPTGLAVDNFPGPTQGRVYVTSGNTHHGGVYAYPAGAATNGVRPPTIPPTPLGGGAVIPEIEIGDPARGPDGILCEGDSCQRLPPAPLDPTLTTLLRGLGNPKVRYRRSRRNCRPKRARGRGAVRGARRCRRASSSAARVGGRGAEARPAIAGTAVSETGAGQGRAGAAAAAPAALAPIEAGFSAGVWDESGEPVTLAGSHPYEVEFTLGLDQGGGDADLRALQIDLPPGLLANPAAVGRCSAAQFGVPRSSPFGPSESGETCPDRTQVGTVEVESGDSGEARRFGLFNLDPEDGAALQLGAAPFGLPLVFGGRIEPVGNGSYALALRASGIPQGQAVKGLRMTIWGAPWDASHNGERGDCLNEAEPLFAWAKCSVGEPQDNKPRAFLTMPTECAPTLAFVARADAWQQPGALSAAALNRGTGGDPAAIIGCGALGFNAEVTQGQLATKKASSASGFVFELENEDERLTDPRARVRSLPKRAVIELPDGVTLNPSLGAGLEACDPGQLASESPFTPHGAGCPRGANIGEFRISSPFYEGSLRGAIYLAKPFENPFGSLIAIYIVAKSAERGLLITAAGRLVPDEGDGTLTAIFDDLPQLPYTDLKLTVRSGQRAALISPPACGAATTRTELTPWSGGAATEVFSIGTLIDSGIDGGACPGGSTPPFAPAVLAGGVNSNVGSYTPYFVRLSRRDTEQEITSYSLVLPKGIVGKLAGIPFCGEAAIAAARRKDGFAETASPSCPAASQVGRTLTGYGVGAALAYAPGRIYLAGPYKGSPLSLVTVNAATVGPFDLGTVVVRSAFDVDPRTAQLSIDSRASDPIPHIIAGIPLHLREVRVYIDRPTFTRNPTGCEASNLSSTLTGSGARFDDPRDDSTATAATHFQLLNCLTLGFRPRLGLRLLGGVRRGEYPGLQATFRARPGDASLKRIAVTMPPSLFLAQNHIRSVCTRAQFAAERCPPGSVYGRATARTPLFDEPLRGPVYLRSSDNKLPDLVASLSSGSVRIVLEGRIGPSRGGGIRAFFDDLPDAPVDRFAMWLRGGRQGLLVNSVNICAASPQAGVKALGQNNRGAIFTTTLRGKCKQDGAPGGRG